MEKKNTILLTVIAVATLLVAVVGATFAYYSLGQTNNFTSTGINASTEDPGSIVGEKSPANLKLTLTAEDMSEANKNHIYYATENDEPHAEAVQNHSLMPVTLTQGSNKDRTYTCTATLTVSVIVKNDASVPATITSGATLKLTPSDNVTIKDSTDDFTTLSITSDIEKSLDVTYKLGTGKLSGDIKADFYIENTNDEQEDLAGKHFEVTLTPSKFNCTMDKE